MDIYSEQYCPICKNKLEDSDYNYRHYHCANSCYIIHTRYDEIRIDIFDKQYIVPRMNRNSTPTKQKTLTSLAIKQQIKQEIDHWIKDDKYLAQILGRE